VKYEDLVRVRDEEKKPTLSRISPDFYGQVNDYIKELEDVERKISRRHSEEAVMIQYELKNALSAVEKIFNKRTRKIIKMASGKAFSKNPGNINHDIDYMTPEERDIYHQMLNTILQGKKKTIEPILGNDTENYPEIPNIQDVVQELDVPEDIETEPAPSTSTEDHEQAVEEKELEVDSVYEPVDEEIQRDITDNEVEVAEVLSADTPLTEDTHEDISSTIETETADSGKKDLNKEYIVVRILKDISTFAGSDGRNYAFNAQDVAVLPKVNAKALLKRKMAVEIIST
jgi:DNA replication factor GINS